MPFLSTRSGLAAKGLGFLASNSPVGQQIYTLNVSGGTNISSTGQIQFTFTVPSGVTSISILCVGAGAWTFGGSGNGGAGGALAYVNNYAVTPGQTFTVIVGTSDYLNSLSSTPNGTLASSRNTTFGGTICGAGGGQSDAFAAPNVGGAVLYGTGFSGGIGTFASGSYSGGGGGAGGYTGAGGNGGGSNAAGASGSGGGGGGGGGSISAGSGGHGGGVGIFGLGANGVGGASNGYTGTGGSGGELITSVQAATNPYGFTSKPDYGAGAGGIRQLSNIQRVFGGSGVVRIVWPGNIRQFPSTNVGNF